MKLTIFLALCLVMASAFADPYSMILTQRNVADTGNNTRIQVVPTSPSIWFYDTLTQLPGYITIGSGLQVISGDLQSIFSGAYTDLTGKPTIPAAQVNADWTAVSGVAAILNRPSLATVATTGAYADLSGKPTIPTVTAFNFGLPSARTLAVSTDYQATDPTKAAVVSVSPSCVNSTTVLAASACTMQTRVGASSLTCSTGTVVNAWTSTYALGLLLTNTSGSPFDIKLPAGAHFILCPTAGTFTFPTAVDQSAS